jgi:hypothetical protein
MGFGPGADAGVNKQMTEIMKECGGQYKSALNANELNQEFSALAAVSVVVMK